MKEFDSNEKICSQAVVDIDNSTEATFIFGLLKSVGSEKSNVLVYSINFKSIDALEVLGSSDDDAGIDKTNDDNTINDSKTDKE